MYIEPATFCWAECIRYFLFSSTCSVRRSLITARTHQLLSVWSIWAFVVYTRWISKPMARFSPFPSLGVALFSFCCKQIRTSSSTFFTSNTYWEDKAENDLLHLSTDSTGRCARWDLAGPTCGFCRKVVLWLMQPPDLLRRGSWRWIQEPLITSSSQVLWMLR